MFESFDIRSSQKTYAVTIGAGLARKILLGEGSPVILADAALAEQLMKPGELNRVISIRADEDNKNLQTVAHVIETMRSLGMNRKSRIIAVGGGMVQDIATFCASTYMRGVEWSYCPTTLLAMVDSCIGGKSSINVGRYKNIAGNFYPPTEIVIDTEYCHSLPLSQKIAGLCEAAKICFADRGEAFDRYIELASGPERFDEATLARLASLSLRTKKKFVEDDEFDNGVRVLLNFGHTFGHAIESASRFSVSHGLAVGLGMLTAWNLSLDLRLVAGDRSRAVVLVDHVRALLGEVPDLGQRLAPLRAREVLERFRSDKKHSNDEYAVILVADDGFPVLKHLPVTKELEDRIVSAIERTMKGMHEIQ